MPTATLANRGPAKASRGARVSNPPAEEWWTINGSCAFLHITRATFYRIVSEGRLRLYHVPGRRSLVKADEVRNLIK